MITPTQKARLALTAARRHGLTVRLDARGRLLVTPLWLRQRLPGVNAVLCLHKAAVKAVLKENQ